MVVLSLNTIVQPLPVPIQATNLICIGRHRVALPVKHRGVSRCLSHQSCAALILLSRKMPQRVCETVTVAVRLEGQERDKGQMRALPMRAPAVFMLL